MCCNHCVTYASRFSVFLVCILGIARTSIAQVDFYYDPVTGNVSFDTSNTGTGSAVFIGLELFETATDIRFDTENMVRLSNSNAFDATPTVYAEVTYGEPWEGLYTVGDILPTGLDEQEWLALFDSPIGQSKTLDRIGGGGAFVADDRFLFGRPDGEFNNRTDLLDLENTDWASEAALLYDPSNGNVILNSEGPGGGFISGLGLTSDHLSYENFVNPVFFAGDDRGPSGIGFHVTEPLGAGVYDLGSLLPLGLNEEQFVASFSSAVFIGDRTVGGIPFRMAVLSAAIPEPSSGCLMFLSIALGGLRRRRLPI